MVTLKAVQQDVVEAIHASRDKAERQARYRATYRLGSNDVLPHWQIEERHFWFRRWFQSWIPVSICETKAQAQELLDRLEHDGTLWPRI